MKHCTLLLINFAADYKNGLYTSFYCVKVLSFIVLNKRAAIDSNSLIPIYLFPVTHLLSIYCRRIKRILK